MKPIAIFRHVAIEGPGYLAEFLDAQGVPWQLIAIDRGDAIPQDVSAYSALVFMGGPMSVNDDLPWIAPVLKLIRVAAAVDMPVLGHCLGGQLISKALGGVVTRNPDKEIGWEAVEVADNPAAQQWLGETRAFTAFHWHGETFSLPPEAIPLLSSAACTHQAYIRGNTLALQCHVEMTDEMVAAWCEVGAEEIANASSPYVQSVAEIKALSAQYLPEMKKIAHRLYTKWLTPALNSSAS